MFAQTSSQEQLQQMARRLQEQLSERSGLFQYYDLSNLEPEENNPDHEDNHNPNLRSQPEEEPNRRISSDLQNQEQERLRAQENLRETMETPVPDSPMASSSATPVPESPIATPSAEENSMNDEHAADTASFHTDHASEATDANMEPVYNSIIQENATIIMTLLSKIKTLTGQNPRRSKLHAPRSLLISPISSCTSFCEKLRLTWIASW